MKKILLLITTIIVASTLSLVGKRQDFQCNQCFKRLPSPESIDDFSDAFEPRTYYFEYNQDTGERYICYQPYKLSGYQPFYSSPAIRCYLAQKILNPSPAVPDGAECWYANTTNHAGGVVLCTNSIGNLLLFSDVKKVCNPAPQNSTFLGDVRARDKKNHQFVLCPIITTPQNQKVVSLGKPKKRCNCNVTQSGLPPANTMFAGTRKPNMFSY